MANGLILASDPDGRNGTVTVSHISGWPHARLQGLHGAARGLQIKTFGPGSSNVNYPFRINLVSGVGGFLFKWDPSEVPEWNQRGGDRDGPELQWSARVPRGNYSGSANFLHTQDVARVSRYIGELKLVGDMMDDRFGNNTGPFRSFVSRLIDAANHLDRQMLICGFRLFGPMHKRPKPI